MQNKQHLCGIDEAGRGPLAGPLVMAGVVLKKKISGLTDSKKLSFCDRDMLYGEIIANSYYHITVIDSFAIDDIGISRCISNGLEDIIENLPGYNYIFDGNSTFGVIGVNTMIKADEKIPEVSAASILSKVTRDRIMIEIDKKYPQYQFESHKGYGTKAHIDAILKFGRCEIHRFSYKIKNIDY